MDGEDKAFFNQWMEMEPKLRVRHEEYEASFNQ